MYLTKRFVRLDRLCFFAKDEEGAEALLLLLPFVDDCARPCLPMIDSNRLAFCEGPWNSQSGMSDGDVSAVGEKISSMRSPNSQKISGQEKSAEVRWDLSGMFNVETAKP